MFTIPKEIIWLKDYKAFINIKKVAEEVGMPKSVLYSFLNDERSLHYKWYTPIAKWVESFKKTFP